MENPEEEECNTSTYINYHNNIIILIYVKLKKKKHGIISMMRHGIKRLETPNNTIRSLCI